MNKKWWIFFSTAIVVGIISVVLGFMISGLNSFGGNILAELAGLSFALALGIYFIEGPILTREQSVQEAISVITRRTLQLNQEICNRMVIECAEHLADKLDTTVDLNGDERGDWIAFKPLLQQIFEEARQVPEKGLPETSIINNNRFTSEEYQLFVEGVRMFIERIHRTIGADWEFIAKSQLLELVDSVDKLEFYTKFSERDEKVRYRWLGTLGNDLIGLVELGARIKA